MNGLDQIRHGSSGDSELGLGFEIAPDVLAFP
jgi:hypothetical protein